MTAQFVASKLSITMASKLAKSDQGARAAIFFCKRGLPSPNISANHMARILSTSYVHVHVHTRTVNVCAMLMISYVILKYAPYDWLKCNPRLQKKKSPPGTGTTCFEGFLSIVQGTRCRSNV